MAERYCTVCTKAMDEGYLDEVNGKYFCSAEHLEKHYPGTVEELNTMDEEELENASIFWTDWHNE